MRTAAISALVSAVVSAGMFFMLHAATGPAGAPSRQLVDVPNLVGLKPDQARQLLEPRGLMLELTEQVDDPRYEPGSICDQQPLSSSRIARGSAIRAKVVRAGERPKVPAIVGRPEPEARAMLEALHLKVGVRTTRADATAPAGVVVASSPVAGASPSPGNLVDLVISTGPAAGAPAAGAPTGAVPPAAGKALPVAAPPAAPAPAAGAGTVPRVTGRTLGRAREILGNAGYEVGAVHRGRDEDVEDGYILKQTPAAGTAAPKGTKVDLVVNNTD